MLSKTEAIVLHTIKYGEQRVIVDMFTRQHGRQSFAMTVPKTSHGKLKKQYFQPLSLLNIECDIRQQPQLQKLRDASILTPLSSLLSTPDKLAIGLFIAEFLYHALRDEQQDPPLFDYVRSSIEWLDGRDDRYANFHLVFLMRLSRFLGFYPNLEVRGYEGRPAITEDKSDLVPSASKRLTPAPPYLRTPDTMYFDLRAASFCETAPTHRDFLMPQEASHIRILMRMDFPTMHLYRLTRAERNRILEILLLYYRLHLPAFPELRSLDVLRELYE